MDLIYLRLMTCYPCGLESLEAVRFACLRHVKDSNRLLDPGLFCTAPAKQQLSVLGTP